MVANGFEGVPWMVSGADHSANIGRVLANLAAGGGSGIVSPSDLKVVQTPQANMQVHMGTGALAVRNRIGAAMNENYVARAIDVSDITLGTPGSSARSDLIVVRVKDPQYPLYADLYPANDPALISGPFAFPEVIPGVPANTVRAEQLNLPQAVYAVARVDLPAGATAVTDGMIKDLRKLVHSRYDVFNSLVNGTNQPLTTSQTAWTNWPTQSVLVSVPDWATHADVSIALQNLGVDGPGNANTRVQLGTKLGSTYYLDYNGANPTYGTFAVETLQHETAASFAVSDIAGTDVVLRLNAQRTFISEAPGTILVDNGTKIKFRVEFFSRPL